MEAKMALVTVLRKFKFEKAPDTEVSCMHVHCIESYTVYSHTGASKDQTGYRPSTCQWYLPQSSAQGMKTFNSV